MRSEWTVSGKEAVIRAKHSMEIGDEFYAYIIDWSDVEEEARKEVDPNGKTILLVEDNELNQEIAQTILEDAGFKVETANAFEEDREKSYEAGMNGHLAKPVRVETLMNTIYKFVK